MISRKEERKGLGEKERKGEKEELYQDLQVKTGGQGSLTLYSAISPLCLLWSEV